MSQVSHIVRIHSSTHYIHTCQLSLPTIDTQLDDDHGRLARFQPDGPSSSSLAVRSNLPPAVNEAGLNWSYGQLPGEQQLRVFGPLDKGVYSQGQNTSIDAYSPEDWAIFNPNARQPEILIQPAFNFGNSLHPASSNDFSNDISVHDDMVTPAVDSVNPHFGANQEVYLESFDNYPSLRETHGYGFSMQDHSALPWTSHYEDQHPWEETMISLPHVVGNQGFPNGENGSR